MSNVIVTHVVALELAMIYTIMIASSGPISLFDCYISFSPSLLSRFFSFCCFGSFLRHSPKGRDALTKEEILMLMYSED